MAQATQDPRTLPQEERPAAGGRGGPRRRRTWSDLFLRSKRLWNRAYRALSYVRSALWVVPFVAIVAVLMLAAPLRWLDVWLGWQLTGLGAAGARTLYETVITLTLSFLVFTFGSLLVAIQVASGQQTPRIIATILLRNNVVRYSVGLFVFTLVLAMTGLNRLEANRPELVALLVIVLGTLCMAVFLFLIDYAARLLRPVTVVARVADEGLKVIDAVYPEQVRGETGEGSAPRLELGPPRRTVLHLGQSEIVVAVDLEGLVAEAQHSDGIVEIVPRVGDFVAHGEPLFALHGGASAIADDRLTSAVAFGSERTMEQDPLFAFRILVDIAIKALSPAINDPTTAVEALAQLHRLLAAVGRRQLRGEVTADLAGRPRVVLRTPNWEDFVHLACHEIRLYGAGNVQIARRLRALIEHLLQALPRHRHAAVRGELDLLDRMIETLFVLPEDRALARIADAQGLGGAHDATSGGSNRGE